MFASNLMASDGIIYLPNTAYVEEMILKYDNLLKTKFAIRKVSDPNENPLYFVGKEVIAETNSYHFDKLNRKFPFYALCVIVRQQEGVNQLPYEANNISQTDLLIDSLNDSVLVCKIKNITGNSLCFSGKDIMEFLNNSIKDNLLSVDGAKSVLNDIKRLNFSLTRKVFFNLCYKATNIK